MNLYIYDYHKQNKYTSKFIFIKKQKKWRKKRKKMIMNKIKKIKIRIIL